jgi:hypothetical protein
MQYLRGSKTCLLLFALLALPAAAQDATPDSQPLGLAQQALSAKAKASTTNTGSSAQTDQGKTVAEMARELQGKELTKARVSPEEAQRILGSVHPILRFASEDSGLPIRSAVKPRMISRDDLVANMQTRKVDDDESKRLQAEELTIKKFGFVPRVFSTGKFVEGMYAEATAGFYDPRTKTISLLNWVSPDSQLSVLAHELTHALQDQNFNLIAWQRTAVPTNPAPARFQVGEAEALAESEGRRAVVEGQAMVVLIDYQMEQEGIPARLEFLPGASSAMSQYLAMMPIPDTPVVHASPIFLRDALAFPYREGLLFELELLGTGGKALAFNKVFARPPLNTHEILEPQAYLRREGVRAPRIPDLSSVLADKYEVIDTGGLGELDIRSLIRQYDTSKLADTISHGWRGSSYLMVKRKGVPTESATTADIALIHVSSWNSSLTAHKFAQFYADAVSRRYAQATAIGSTCQGADCPLESFQFNTEEGFVSIECRPNNLVLVTESFDPDLAGTLSAAILKTGPNKQTAQAVPDLSLRYASSPVFSDMREMWAHWFVLQVAKLSEK